VSSNKSIEEGPEEKAGTLFSCFEGA